LSKWVAPSDKRFVCASCQTVIARDHSAAHLSRDRYFPKVTRCDGRPSQPAKNLLDLARRETLTVRQLYGHVCNGAGHHAAVGTPAQIADRLQHWFENGAADGFNILAPYLPGGLEDFVDLVVPELQHRGLFRTKYEGTTLRDHLGLARPVLVKELVRASQ
jgi:N-acetyl-S-(2-succino)cysteine monooxygenase